jgi:hypothetical protein
MCLHIPSWAPHTYGFIVLISLTHPRQIILVVLQTTPRWNRKSQRLISTPLHTQSRNAAISSSWEVWRAWDNPSTNFSIIIITRGWHSRPIGGRSAEWTQLDSLNSLTKRYILQLVWDFVCCVYNMHWTSSYCCNQASFFCAKLKMESLYTYSWVDRPILYQKLVKLHICISLKDKHGQCFVAMNLFVTARCICWFEPRLLRQSCDLPFHASVMDSAGQCSQFTLAVEHFRTWKMYTEPLIKLLYLLRSIL